MNRKEGIKNISLTFSEIEMLKYRINEKIIELSNCVKSHSEDVNIVEILEAEIKRHSDLYVKLYEALL